jgi:hypothetical protein
VLLRFGSERRFYDTNTPFFFQIGTFSQDFLFEIVREPVLAHGFKIAVPVGLFNQPGSGLSGRLGGLGWLRGLGWFSRLWIKSPKVFLGLASEELSC